MITAFLNFARPQPLQLEDVNLDELIGECARELAPAFERRRVELIIKSSSFVPAQRSRERGSSPTVREGSRDQSLEQIEETQRIEVQADIRMLRQALLNLLRNAVEAVPEDKTDRRVMIRTATETGQGKQWATISIRDTGEGIAESDTQKIFIPFFTTKSKGHGIGLALAHRVITEHGGTLTAANALGGGAVFTIRLPQ
jgi:signal transduction histidine kinase